MLHIEALYSVIHHTSMKKGRYPVCTNLFSNLNISPIDIITDHCIVTLIHIYILQENALEIFVCKMEANLVSHIYAKEPVNGLVKTCHNCVANTLGWLQSGTKPSLCLLITNVVTVFLGHTLFLCILLNYLMTDGSLVNCDHRVCVNPC